MSKNKLEEMELFAWMGEDELGSGEIGIKQGFVPAGMIPLVSIKKEKINTSNIRNGLAVQSCIYGKKIKLCRFKFIEVVESVGNDSSRN